MPASALKDLAEDDEVVSITPDHALKAMDDETNDAVGVAAAWQAGYKGSGIGVAIIDSGVNDSSDDLSGGGYNQHSRVAYHQDFTGTATSNHRSEEHTSELPVT